MQPFLFQPVSEQDRSKRHDAQERNTVFLGVPDSWSFATTPFEFQSMNPKRQTAWIVGRGSDHRYAYQFPIFGSTRTGQSEVITEDYF